MQSSLWSLGWVLLSCVYVLTSWTTEGRLLGVPPSTSLRHHSNKEARENTWASQVDDELEMAASLEVAAERAAAEAAVLRAKAKAVANRAVDKISSADQVPMLSVPSYWADEPYAGHRLTEEHAPNQEIGDRLFLIPNKRRFTTNTEASEEEFKDSIFNDPAALESLRLAYLRYLLRNKLSPSDDLEAELSRDSLRGSRFHSRMERPFQEPEKMDDVLMEKPYELPLVRPKPVSDHLDGPDDVLLDNMLV
ncbi:hypothetical protein CRM22_003036 [Opisthorchis felineus]|uniref:Uncharacterized protein n=1 Tax=Opisthorchis felineus TaxID=147828 RepID=A0A4S2M9D3_OPIFE|nr:hypothetical protein CRM22_003036 [Opisthorchis felineus]